MDGERSHGVHHTGLSPRIWDFFYLKVCDVYEVDLRADIGVCHRGSCRWMRVSAKLGRGSALTVSDGVNPFFVILTTTLSIPSDVMSPQLHIPSPFV